MTHDPRHDDTSPGGVTDQLRAKDKRIEELEAIVAISSERCRTLEAELADAKKVKEILGPLDEHEALELQKERLALQEALRVERKARVKAEAEVEWARMGWDEEKKARENVEERNRNAFQFIREHTTNEEIIELCEDQEGGGRESGGRLAEGDSESTAASESVSAAADPAALSPDDWDRAHNRKVAAARKERDPAPQGGKGAKRGA